MNIRYVLLLTLMIGWGCQEKKLYEEDIQLMSQLQCEARRLKEERFGVANTLRFRNDSLTKLGVPLTEVQKQEEDSLRKLLTYRTEEVATRLTRTMDSLFDVHYTTIEQRQEFDAAVEKKVKEVCE